VLALGLESRSVERGVLALVAFGIARAWNGAGRLARRARRLPPSPLFASEVLIVAGGFAAGRPWTAAATALLLGLGFLGLAQALIEMLAGKAKRRERGPLLGLRGVAILAAATVPVLLALGGAALWLPGSELARALAEGIR
jgi:hypothetical protein